MLTENNQPNNSVQTIVSDNYVDNYFVDIISSLKKIISHKSFENLPDVYQTGIKRMFAMSEDEYKFYSQLYEQPFERKVIACEKIIKSAVETNLVSSNHFFYQMFSGIGVVASKKMMEKVATAAVLYDSRYNNKYMLYNPDFILYCYKVGGLQGINFIICHEMSHIILSHVDYRNGSHNSFNILENTKSIENIGQDLYINSFLSEDNETYHLISNGVFPGVFPYHDFPPGLSTDQYISLLRQKDRLKFEIFELHSKISNQTSHNMSIEDFLDEVEVYESNGRKPEDLTSKKSPDFMEKLYDINKIEKSIFSSKSQTNQNIDKLIASYIKSKKVKLNPEDIFNYFLQQADIIIGKESSNRKLNKKSPYRLPGSKFIRQANVAFYCDMSGSVGDDLLACFFDIVKTCCEQDRVFDFIPFTTEIDDSNIISITSMTIPEVRPITGGTDFSCINRHAIERGYSGVVVLTDMEAPYPGEIGIPRLWVTNHDMRDFKSETVLNFSLYK